MPVRHASLVLAVALTFAAASASPADARRTVDPERRLWALLVATSSGWDSYRHQADVLAQYQALRSRGLPDERIVLVLADDLANSHLNPQPGTVTYPEDTANLRLDADIDLTTGALTGDELLAILGGRSSPRIPDVIESGPHDDVYVFVAGHADERGLQLDGATLTAPRLLAQLEEMQRDHRFRHLVVALEACNGGGFDGQLDLPGVAVITAARVDQASYATGYDEHGDVWRADELSLALHHELTSPLDGSFADLVARIAPLVRGSTATVIGDASGSAEAFFQP